MDRIRLVLIGDRKVTPWLWVGLIAVAVLSGTLIWLVMPDVPWFAKVPVALVAIAYMAVQTAMYLARDDEASDDGRGPDKKVEPAPKPDQPRLVIRIRATEKAELPEEPKHPDKDLTPTSAGAGTSTGSRRDPVR